MKRLIVKKEALWKASKTWRRATANTLQEDF